MRHSLIIILLCSVCLGANFSYEDFVPNADSTLNLGASGLDWSELHVDTIFTPTISGSWVWAGTSVDATWSDAPKTIKVADEVDGLIIKGGGDNYFNISPSSPGGSTMLFGNVTTDPVFGFVGDGAFNKTGTGPTTLGGTLSATIVTAGEFNTTGSLGNIGTLAAFGVDETTVPQAGRLGLLEVAALGAGKEIPAGMNAGISVNLDRDIAAVSASQINAALMGFNSPSGVQTETSSEYGVFGGIAAAVTPTTGTASKTTFLYGLTFSTQNNEDWISSVGLFPTTKTINTRGVSVVSSMSASGKEISGTKTKGINAGIDVTSSMLGEYSAGKDGENFGVCITVTDGLDDASTGDIESVGLDITVPVGSTHGGGGALTSYGIKQNSDVPNFINGQLRLGDVVKPTEALEVNGVSQFGDGGTTDYSEFEADGTLEFNGAATVWDDLQVGISNVRITGGGSTTERFYDHGIGGGVTFPVIGFDVGEYIYFDVQTSHSMKLSTVLDNHIHFVLPNTTTIGHTFAFQLDVIAAGIDVAWAVPAGSPYTSVDHAVASGDNTTHRLLEIADIAAVNTTVSSIYKCKLTRVAPAAGTTYASEVYLEFTDCHYEVNTVGSRTELAK